MHKRHIIFNTIRTTDPWPWAYNQRIYNFKKTHSQRSTGVGNKTPPIAPDHRHSCKGSLLFLGTVNVIIISQSVRISLPWPAWLTQMTSGDSLWREVESVENTLRPTQDGHYLSNDTFESFFVNENVRISIEISLKFVRINNITALVQIMAWRQAGDNPLSEPMMVRLPTHICVTRPQWVKFEAVDQSLEHWLMLTRTTSSTWVIRTRCLMDTRLAYCNYRSRIESYTHNGQHWLL